MATAFSRKIMTGIEKIIALIKSTIDSYHNTNQASHTNGFNHNITVTGNVDAHDGFRSTGHSHLRTIELGYGTGSTDNHGGFIDFHYNGSTADYTARIIEDASGVIKITPALTTPTATITTANITTANITTTISNTIKPNNTNYVTIMRDGKVNTALSVEGYNNPLVRIKNKGVDYRNMKVDKGSGYVALTSSNTFAESGEVSLNVDANNHYIALDGTDLMYDTFTINGTTYTGTVARHYISLYKRYPTTDEEEMGARLFLYQYETSKTSQSYWLTTNCLLVNVRCQTPINNQDVVNKQYVDTKTSGSDTITASMLTVSNDNVVWENAGLLGRNKTVNGVNYPALNITSVKGKSYYRKHSDGFIEQWGWVKCNSLIAGGQGIKITFPTAYTNHSVVIITAMRTTVDVDSSKQYMSNEYTTVWSTSTTNFIVRHANQAQNNHYIAFYWHAVGK